MMAARVALFPVLFLGLIVLVLPNYVILRKKTKMPLLSAVFTCLLLIASVVIVDYFFVNAMTKHMQIQNRSLIPFFSSRIGDPLLFSRSYPEKMLWIFFSIFPVMLGGTFIIVLARKWFYGDVTEEERQPGARGVRAWLRFSNLLWVFIIALTAWMAFGVSFWGLLFTGLGLLAAYPLFNSTQEPGVRTAAPVKRAPSDLAEERAHVLKMLEEGKIKGDEASELLSALGETIPPAVPKPAPLTGARKLIIFGAALTLAGFFLPWFSINFGAELQKNLNDMQQGLSVAEMLNPNKPQIIRISGGDAGRGMGWLILLMALATAALPYLGLRMDTQTIRAVSLVALSLGGLALLYLLTSNMRFISMGAIIVLAGYVLEFTGLLKERQTNGF